MLVKKTEYELNYDPKNAAHLPGTEHDTFVRAHGKPSAWSKITLPVEKESTYKHEYHKQPIGADADPKSRAEYVELYHRNRNGPTYGNKFSSIDKGTNYKVEFTPKKGEVASITFNPDFYKTSSSAIGSKDVNGTGSSNFKGYRSPHQGTTTYSKNFVDYHVKHCECKHVANPNRKDS